MAGQMPRGCVNPGFLWMTTPEGQFVHVQVALARTPEARATGLMGRTELPPATGMLFIYDSPRPVSFWMKGTLIPLDMVFLDETGTVRHVHASAQPLDETPVPGAAEGDPAPDRLMVLELAGGEAARLGIVPGTVLQHADIPQDRAAWPCRDMIPPGIKVD